MKCFVLLLVVAVRFLLGLTLTTPSDSDVLVDFKNHLIGYSNGILDNWTESHEIHFCNWTGVTCHPKHPQRVQALELPGQGLHGTLPASLGRLKHLEVLRLGFNSFIGTIPVEIGNCTMLKRLALGNNSFSGEIPNDMFLNLQHLEYLYLWDNKLQGHIPASIGNWTRLKDLVLYSNDLTGIIPEHIFHQLQRLQKISLQDNLLSGNIPESIGNLTSLFSLNLGYNKLTAAALMQCKHLSILELSGNKLEGEIPPEMGEIQSLNELYLSRNRLTGKIPNSIGNLPRLQYLDVSENRLYGMLPYSLERLGTSLLTKFDISSNNFQGEIPTWIGAFDKVVDMSFASNNFSGVIPSSIKQCKGLVTLNMSSNKLSGDLPSALGELQLLQVLDLSMNNLNGLIPISLTALSNMVTLNLSRNDLQGPIPLEGIFSKLNQSSFLGNPRLCGPLVNMSCPSPTHHTHHKHNTVAWLLSVVSLVVVMAGGLVRYTVSRMRGTSSSIGASPGGPLKVFSLQKLLSMTNNFDNSNLIGQGGYSNVFRASWEGKPMAVKVMKQEVEDIHEMKKSFIAETKTLSRIRHRNIVKLLGYCWTEDMLALVMEYMPNGSLGNYLAANTLNYASKLSIAVDVAHAVHYIHHEFDVPLIHCDLKPENVLLDSDSVAKLSDFGISKLMYTRNDNTVSVSKFRGTIGYTPPEYASSSVVSTAGDVFGYGMLLLVMTTGKSPTDEVFHESGTLRNRVLDNFDIEGEEETEKLLIQIGLLCTSANPADRPTMKVILAMLTDMKNSGGTGTTLSPLEVLIEEILEDDSRRSFSI